jgi:hypothetical protein
MVTSPAPSEVEGGKEREAPRVHQLPRYRRHADAHHFSGVEFDWLGGYGQRFEPSWCDRDAAIEGNGLLGDRDELDREKRTRRNETEARHRKGH